MTSAKQLLDAFGIVPKKSLGQNFLHDPNVLAAIVNCAELPSSATVLEIGSGTGALTKLLAQTVRQVVAIETDERLCSLLTQQLAPFANVTLYWTDFLKADVDALVGGNEFYVVANLPYYITSAIIRKLLTTPHRPRRLVLTMQKEVAERILARPGNMGLLSVSVQFYGNPQLVMRLKPAVFWPRPDVESAVIRLDITESPVVAVPDEATFFKVVRAGFGQKRKQLKNTLTAGLSINADQSQQLLARAHIDGSRRAQTLTLEEWALLAWQYKALFF